MFRKPFSINQTHKVSGADRKKIRRSVEKALHLDGDSTALDALLPAKQGDLELAKLPAPSRLVIYLLDGLPVLLDMSGKSDFVPTVMGLWSSPGLLPVVMCKAWQVSQYLCGGADLMLPGVDIASLPDFNKGDLLAVSVPGNPAPVAVGAAVMNSMTAKGQAAGKGRLLEVLQHYGDTLWQGLGGQAVPNDGFQQGFVAPLDLIAAATAEVESAAAADAAAEGVEQLGISSSSSSSGQANHTQLDTAAAAAAATGSSDAAAGSCRSNGGSSADMDDLMERSLLQALLKSIKETDLPLNSSSLWSQHITPCRPVGSTLDVKKSSHKKMSKFLQVYTKAGLITTREEKHSGDTLLTGTNLKHNLFDDFRTHKTAAAAAGGEAAAGPTAAAAAAAAAATGGGQDAVLEPLLVEEVYVPSKEVKPIFQAVGADVSGCYTAAEAGEVAFAYAKQQQLDVQGPDERTLLLDVVLCDALYKGVLRKGEIFPTTIPKANLREAFLKRCSQQTRISRGRQQVLRWGNPPAVQISGERRQGNKHVTRVVGVEAFLIDPVALASECQRKYACSTTVGDLPGKNNPGQEFILQGNVIEKLPDYLMKIYGIPKKYFLVKK